MSIKTGPQSKGNKKIGLFVFPHSWMDGHCLSGGHMVPRCTKATSQSRWGSVKCFGRCFAGRGPPVQVFCGTCPTHHWRLCTAFHDNYSRMAVASFNRKKWAISKQKWLWMFRWAEQVWDFDLLSRICRSKSNRGLNVLIKTANIFNSGLSTPVGNQWSLFTGQGCVTRTNRIKTLSFRGFWKSNFRKVNIPPCLKFLESKVFLYVNSFIHFAAVGSPRPAIWEPLTQTSLPTLSASGSASLSAPTDSRASLPATPKPLQLQLDRLSPPLLHKSDSIGAARPRRSESHRNKRAHRFAGGYTKESNFIGVAASGKFVFGFLPPVSGPVAGQDNKTRPTAGWRRATLRCGSGTFCLVRDRARKLLVSFL